MVQRDAAAVPRLLRQLASGFSVYRLYPGALEMTSFVAAVERIRAAATTALADGPVRAELRKGRFVVDETPIADDALSSLATACFERRVEHLRIEHPPSVDELGSLFAALSAPAARVEEAGGAAALLERDGVASIHVSVGAPEAASGDEVPEHLLSLADWVQAVEGSVEDALLELPVEALTDGAALYATLRELSEMLPDQAIARSTFFVRATERVSELASAEQARFGRLVLDDLEASSFAERYAGHLSDLSLAELVATVAVHEGGDPVTLAREVVARADRHDTLVELATAETAAVPDPAAGPTAGLPAETPPTVSAGESAATALLQAEFPDNEVEARQLALVALQDYLLLEPREEQLGSVLAATTEQLRRDLRRGDVAAVLELLDVLDTVAARAPPGVSDRLRAPRRDAVDARLVEQLLDERQDGQFDSQLFEPFGGDAIDALVAVLGAVEDDTHRRALTAVLEQLARAHLDRIEPHLGWQRAEVVAELVGVIAAGEGDRALMPLFERLGYHTSPWVLEAVVEALAGREPAAAAPVVAGIAQRSPQRGIKRRCLDVLAGYEDPAGVDQLQLLARRDARPGLPWGLRRRARALARRAGARR